MRLVRGLALAPLVPLVAVGLLGVASGYRSVIELGQFVLVWALFLYPLVVALAFTGFLVGRRTGCTSRANSAVAGLALGSLLTAAWFAGAGSAPLAVVGLTVSGGLVGAATAAVFWYLAVRPAA